MSFEALYDDESGQEKALRLARDWSTGKRGGIVTTQCKKEHLDQFEEKAKKDLEDSKNNLNSLALPNKVAYTFAAWRDAKYALRGRRWMRAMACTGLATAAVNRAASLIEIKKLKDKEK